MGLIRKGLLGCTGALALVVLVFAILAVMAWLQVRNGESTPVESVRDLDSATVEPTLLDLEIGWAFLSVTPAELARTLTLSTSFDPKRYLFEESTEQEIADTGIHRVHLAPRGSGMMAALRPVVGGDLPRIEIELPPRVPLKIRARLNGGIAAFDLGKLQLVNADLSMNTGLMQVMFREPTAWLVERLELSCRRGNLVLYNMGHASPRRLVAHHGMGPAFFDLAGEWKADAEVEITVAFGSGEVRVPNHVNIRGLEGSYAEYNRKLPGGSTETPPSTLDVNVHFDAGFIQMTGISE